MEIDAADIALVLRKCFESTHVAGAMGAKVTYFGPGSDDKTKMTIVLGSTEVFEVNVRKVS